MKKALSSLAMGEPERDTQQLLDKSYLATIERPVPARVVWQAARRHAMKARQPPPEPSMVAIHVLDVDGVPVLAIAAGTAASGEADFPDESDDAIESGSRMRGVEHLQPLRPVKQWELR